MDSIKPMKPMKPMSIEFHAEIPEIVVVTHDDGSRIHYLSSGDGFLAPGYLVTGYIHRDKHVVTFFVPFGQAVIPQVLRVQGCE